MRSQPVYVMRLLAKTMRRFHLALKVKFSKTASNHSKATCNFFKAVFYLFATGSHMMQEGMAGCNLVCFCWRMEHIKDILYPAISLIIPYYSIQITWWKNNDKWPHQSVFKCDTHRCAFHCDTGLSEFESEGKVHYRECLISGWHKTYKGPSGNRGAGSSSRIWVSW